MAAYEVERSAERTHYSNQLNGSYTSDAVQ